MLEVVMLYSDLKRGVHHITRITLSLVPWLVHGHFHYASDDVSVVNGVK